jgi:NAD(P)-dependent dehydrogenase (short-subunit alcohol dehydrogenase family)
MRIEGSVVVVTGASSGIGRATALALADRGAHVALLARRADALEEVAAQCGPRALVLPVDVTDADAVDAAARRTVEHFGRIDGWVNNAAVTMFGPLLDVPLADFRRVLDVNLMGYVHGARSALPHLVAGGSGVLVNVSSLLGRIAQPYGAAYTMSKFAVRGLGVSLREELRLSGARGVSVSTVLPAAIDTPIYAAAANYTGRTPHPPPPVYTPERVARTIIRQLRHPRPEVVAGGLLGRAFVLQHILTPRVAERILAIDVARSLQDPPAPPTSGALYEPGAAPAAVHGGWDGAGRERRRRLAGLTAAAAISAAVGASAARYRDG